MFPDQRVLQVVSGSYGLYTWPSAPVLAQWVWHHRSRMPGARLLELGAGTALPGILAAKCGAHVTLSDSAHLTNCLSNSARSCQANNIDIPVIGLTWGLFTPSLLSLPSLNYIIASDCFYDPSVFEEILVTVSYLLDKNPSAEFLCSYQERASDWSLEALLHKWGLACHSIPLHSIGADSKALAGSRLPGSHKIHLFQIKKTWRSSS